jgi:cytidylate kinase
MSLIEKGITHIDQSHKRQEYEVSAVNLDMITISGQSGCLKTSIASDVTRICSAQMSMRGEELREELRRTQDIEVLDFVPRDPELDHRLDLQTLYDLEDSIERGQPIIVEGRLAAVIAKEAVRIRQSNRTFPQMPRVYSILLLSENPEIRAHRVWKRQVKLDPTLTLEEILHLNESREKQDIEYWNSLYPHLLKGQNPFDPQFTDQVGNNIYDLVVRFDQTDLASHHQHGSGPVRDEMVKTIIDTLVEKKLIDTQPRYNQQITAS